ncbi:MAG: Ig-like domain-containing protein [Gemmatimonadaceae bacterium]
MGLIACGADGGSGSTAPTPAPVASVRVSPTVDTLIIGDSTNLRATALDATGAALAGRTILWTTTAPNVIAIGTVGAEIKVVALALGTAIVGANSEHQQGTARVVVVNGAVYDVRVLPATAELTVPQQIQLTVIVKDVGGHPITDRSVQFLSLAPSIASVSATGLVTAVGAGQTKIAVTSDGVSDTAKVRVAP